MEIFLLFWKTLTNYGKYSLIMENQFLITQQYSRGWPAKIKLEIQNFFCSCCHSRFETGWVASEHSWMVDRYLHVMYKISHSRHLVHTSCQHQSEERKKRIETKVGRHLPAELLDYCIGLHIIFNY